MQLLLKKYSVEILLLLIWIIIIIVVKPYGEFPINDDWAYSKTVYHLAQEGKFQMGDWPAMTLISQALLGTLVCKLFGFSFSILRISTIVISIANTFLFYFFIKEITNNKKHSFFISLVWLFNPVCFLLSFTFMTEIYFLFFSLLTLFFYFKYFKNEKIFFIALGTFFALAATFTRQQGIILPLAFGIVQIIKLKRNIKNIVFSFIPFIIILFALLKYVSWLDYRNDLPPDFGKIEDLADFFDAKNISAFYSRMGLIFFYIGLFLLPPMLLFFLPCFKISELKRKIIVVTAVCAVLIPAMITAWNFFPTGNILNNLSLGPKLLKDTWRGHNLHPALSNEILDGIRVLCIFSVIILIVFLSEAKFQIKNYFKNISFFPVRLIKFYSSIVFIAFLGFTIIDSFFFDRYCLPLILFLLIIAVPVNQNFSFKKSLAGILVLTVFSTFSILSTHDYFSWNRARWEAINYLMKEINIQPTQIDGGFEFNAWYETGPRNPLTPGGKSWWFVADDDYVLSSGDISGFQKIKKFSYQRYLPCEKGFVYILMHKRGTN